MASNSQEFYVIDAVDKHSNIVRYLAFDEYNAELTMTSDVDTCLHFKTYDELARWLSAYKEEIKKKIEEGTAIINMEEYNKSNSCLKIESSNVLYIKGASIVSSTTITNVSDARMKNHISDLPKGFENMFDYLDGKSFFYNNSQSTAKNHGFIAQEVLSALQKCGLSTDDFAGFCDINGDGSQYALAYEQFIPIMWNEIKRLRNQVKELKGE